MVTSVTSDYYSVLGLQKDCTDADIKKAYRKLAIQWHPDKNESSDKDAVQETFRRIAEAFTVLTNKKRRTIFDQYGVKGLKNGVEGFIPAWSYNENPEEQFSDFFGSVSPFAEFFQGDSGFVPMFSGAGKAKTGKVDTQTINLYCSLEELYLGCSKKVSITRDRLNLDGKTVTSEDVYMTVEVQAGWRDGTKITHTCEGDEAPGMSTGDVIFLLKQKPHPRFVREKKNLIYTAKITLADALIGTTVEVKMLDGRVIPVPINEIVKPNQQKLVAGEGMPWASDPTKKGDLLIEFNVQYPDMLNDFQKVQIKEALTQ